MLSEDTFENFTVIANYYTLKNNLDNKRSSVYISDNPTLDEVIRAAVQLPSDNFFVMKGQYLVNVILFTDIPRRMFLVVNPTTGVQQEYPCGLKGDLTENRAREIMKNYAPDAKISGSEFQVNGRKLDVIHTKTIKASVMALIATHHLDTGELSVKIPSKADLKKTILEKSKPGGDLDFFTEIKDHEMDGAQVKPGVFTSKISIALYQWGSANFDLGINTVDDALEIWTEIKGRDANQREKEYIKMGFNKELEK